MNSAEKSDASSYCKTPQCASGRTSKAGVGNFGTGGLLSRRDSFNPNTPEQAKVFRIARKLYKSKTPQGRGPLTEITHPCSKGLHISVT